MGEQESKRELLRDKVVDLVKEFIKTEGEISTNDLSFLFGPGQIANVLGEIPISLLRSGS